MKIVKNFLQRLLSREKCPERLSFSLALGFYIAFCPLVGLHTVLSVIFAWIFSLNVLVLLAISNTINNPLTMIPIYASGHVVGKWIIGDLLGINLAGLDPWWMDWLTQKISYAVGISQLSLTSFFIGGNVLGLVLALVVYPFARYGIHAINVKFKAAKKCFNQYKEKRHLKKNFTKKKELLNENCSPK